METSADTTTHITPVERVLDWEAIERDYRAGLLSTREIAGQHSISHTAINKRAKAESWDRDLSIKIKAKAEALVSRRLVSIEVSKNNLATERQIVDAGAQRIADVRSEHRQDIERARSLCKSLLAELEAQTFDPAMTAQLGELMRAPNDDGVDKLNDLYRKIISTPGRIDSAKKLVEAMKSVVAMEREAFGLDKEVIKPPEDSIAAFLAGMKRSALPIVHDVLLDDSV